MRETLRIPSYDDLAPSIPDISLGDVFTSTAALLPSGGPVDERPSRPSTPHQQSNTSHSAPRTRSCLFAALHGMSPADRLVAIARDFSPRIERWPDGSVVLDVAGLQRLLGEPSTIAAHLARAGAPRVAIATSQVAAVLLARACAGVTVATGNPEAALRDVPIALLQQLLEDVETADERVKRRIHSKLPTSTSQSDGPAATGGNVLTEGAVVARVTPLSPVGALEVGSWKLGTGVVSCPGPAFDVLRRWGLTTVGEFAAVPAPELSARLGSDGIALQRLARGIDPRPLIPDPGVTRFLEMFELEWPTDTLEPLSFVFARLLEPLASALERADRGAVAIHLHLRLTGRTSHTRSLQLPAPMRDPRVLRTLLLLDLESHPPSAAVDVVSIELDPAPGRIVQFSLLERAVPSPETLATLMARLGALVGETRCGSPVLLDTHRADGFVMGSVRFGETRTPSPPNSQLPTAVGSWELTSPTAAPQSLLRRFRPPVAIRVAMESGRPICVAIDRQRMPGGVVLQVAGPWRTSGAWWQSARWNRDEWEVALSDGSICRLFRDRDGEGWFMEGVFD